QPPTQAHPPPLHVALPISQAGNQPLADWVRAGLPGTRSRWEDPVDQTLVGLSATVRSDAALTLTPVPRRAVGPDLSTFFVGERRVGRLARVTLRVHPVAETPSRSLPSNVTSHDAVSDAEASAWERAVAAQLV